MPRRNRRARVRKRRVIQEVERPLTYDEMAWQLVNRGLAPKHILGARDPRSRPTERNDR
jgi:hypothetical protein